MQNGVPETADHFSQHRQPSRHPNQAYIEAKSLRMMGRALKMRHLPWNLILPHRPRATMAVDPGGVT